MRKVALHVNRFNMHRINYAINSEGLNFSLALPIHKNRTVDLYATKISKQNLLALGEDEPKEMLEIDHGILLERMKLLILRVRYMLSQINGLVET